MAVSHEDRARMRRLAQSLTAIERDDPGTIEDRKSLLSLINQRRVADGRPPLVDEDEMRPEEGFYRRARSLGMARTDR
jgi:hypothetical protein